MAKEKETGTADIPASDEKQGFWKRTWLMYYEGFRDMTVGRSLWIIILAKLAVMFLVFKLFFFPNILERDYDTDEDRAQAVREHLMKD